VTDILALLLKDFSKLMRPNFKETLIKQIQHSLEKLSTQSEQVIQEKDSQRGSKEGIEQEASYQNFLLHGFYGLTNLAFSLFSAEVPGSNLSEKIYFRLLLPLLRLQVDKFYNVFQGRCTDL